jgi:hypothetical protein
MEYIRILWIIVFFFFSLSLIFIWSKILVLFRRITAIHNLLQNCENIVKELGKAD